MVAHAARFHKNLGVWNPTRWVVWGQRLVTHVAKPTFASAARTLPQPQIFERTLGLSVRARELQSRFVTHGGHSARVVC